MQKHSAVLINHNSTTKTTQKHKFALGRALLQCEKTVTNKISATKDKKN